MATTITFDFKIECPTFRDEMSSNQLDNLFYFALQGPDNVYTYTFRAARLVSYDLPHQHSALFSTQTQGILVDTVSQDIFLGILTTLVMLGFSFLAAVYYYYEEQEKEEEKKRKARRQYKNSNDQIQSLMNPQPSSKEEEKTHLSKAEKSQELAALNECLTRRLTQPAFQAYERAVLTQRDDKTSLTLVKKTPVFLSNILDASWKVGLQSSFIYWIGWIGSGCITGVLSVGIFGVTPWLGFGLPLLLGSLPRWLQIAHWVKRQLEIDPAESDEAVHEKGVWYEFKQWLGIRYQPTLEDVAIANQLMVSCLREREIALECQRRGVVLPSMDKKVEVGRENNTSYAAAKIFAAGILSAGTTYAMAHYILWLGSDIFPAVLLNGFLVDFFAIAAFAMAGIYGVLAMRKKLEDVKERDALAGEPDIAALTNEYNGIQWEMKEIDNHYTMTWLKKPSPEKECPDTSKEKHWVIRGIRYFANRVGQFLKHPIPRFFNGAMGGVYIARIFLVLCTSPFLPSGFHMATTVAALSNPAILAIIGATFLVWGTFRYYTDEINERDRKQKEALESTVAEKEFIQHQIQLARIKLMELESKQSVKPLKVLSSPPQKTFSSFASGLSFLEKPGGGVASVKLGVNTNDNRRRTLGICGI